MQKIVKLDSLSRVHIPKRAIGLLGWVPGDLLTLEVQNNKVIVSGDLLEKECKLCGELFNDNYAFCPFDGEGLMSRKKEDSGEK